VLSMCWLLLFVFFELWWASILSLCLCSKLLSRRFGPSLKRGSYFLGTSALCRWAESRRF
jgi:hypothetical protein